MKLGTLYQLRKDATNQDGEPLKRFFCFGNDTGRFIGYTDSIHPWPRFNHGKGKESCINCANPDDLLEEIEG